MKNDGGPAFPQFEAPVFGGHPVPVGGMSLRDWFAGQALANVYTHQDGDPDKVADWAYQVADAIIAARGAK